MKHFIICAILVALLSACSPTVFPAAAAPSLTPQVTALAATATLPSNPTPLAPKPTVPVWSVEQLKNASYRLSILEGLQVTLVDGKFSLVDAAKNLSSRGQLIEPVVFGDLNGDGTQDALVIIAINTGGSGTFHELVVLLGGQGQVASRMLGDRIVEKRLAMQDGKIILEYLRAGPNDGLCCPSQHVQTTFQLQNDALNVLADEILAPLPTPKP